MPKLVSVLLSFFIVNFSLNAQKVLSTQDSIRMFYKSFFDILKKKQVFKDTVNWEVLENQTGKRLLTYETMDASMKEVSTILLTIGDFHSSLIYKGKTIQARQINFPKELFSDSWIAKFETKPLFDVKVLDNHYGYILMPGIHYTSNLDFDKVTQGMYDKIHSLQKDHALKGWIIDLRFNTGGTCVPMLLSLYDFLGKGIVWKSIDNNGALTETVTFKGGRYISNGKSVAKIRTQANDLEKTKVAILTGVVTGSSGEIVCIAFKCRPNTLFIGGKTAGFTTVNNTFQLPFNAVIALANSHASDCNLNRYSYITPDYSIHKNDNFENLLSDEHIQIAIRYFNKNQ